MITPAYVQTMAAYNAETNRRWFDAAARLPDAERRADRGAFFRSMHGTLCHLLWADRMWMSRFAGWDRPAQPIGESAALVEAFGALRAARIDADAGLCAWAATVDAGWLAGMHTWFSGAAGREVTRPTALLVMHMFNHQAHHRGQVHALLTAAGEATGDTDLWLLAPAAFSGDPAMA